MLCLCLRGWWMEATTVRPLRASFCMTCITLSAAKASRPDE
jgi:hypothetical protein